MKKVSLRQKNLASYRRFIGAGQEEMIRESARALADLRIVHLNATPDGGGVAEILQSLVPLMKHAGVNVDWYVLEGDDDFFRITKMLHNQLQGEPGELSLEETDIYLMGNERIYDAMLDVGADLWVIHDPQPAVAGAMLDGSSMKVWRSHIDTSTPNQTAWNLLAPHVSQYDAVVYSHESYCFPDAAF